MKTIAIIAPLGVQKSIRANFILRLKKNNQELSLTTLYELARNDFEVERISQLADWRDQIPAAAGYYLSSLLRQNGYNTILTEKYDDKSLQKIASKDPFAVCISSTLIMDNVLLQNIIMQIRRFLPKTFIIVGGTYVWKAYKINAEKKILPEQMFVSNNGLGKPLFMNHSRETRADFFVASPHGKETLLTLLKELERGQKADFEHIPNLAFPDGKSGFAFTPRCEEKVDYNEDYTHWDLIDELPQIIPVRTSVGCPYRCRYCDFWPLHSGKIFLRSTKSLLNELQTIKKCLKEKPGKIWVTDDNVFINENRLNEICNTFITADIPWYGFIRADSIHPKNIGLIKESKLFFAMLGIESGDAGQLMRMNKSQNLTNFKQGIELLDQNEVHKLMTFVVGFPGETEKTINNTINFLNNLAIGKSYSGYSLFPLLIAPLSDLHKPDFRKKWKIKGIASTWEHYTMHSNEVGKYIYQVFKQVQNVPYFYYSEEPTPFSNKIFTNKQKMSLFNLRQRLTVELIEQSPWSQIATTLADISRTMGFSGKKPDKKFSNELMTPNVIQGDNGTK